MANKVNQDDEYGMMSRILNFRLSHGFKKFGLIGAILIFLFLLSTKFMGGQSIIVKDVLRTLVLLFLLIASLSQDKLEDEYIQHIRQQSLVVAFFFTVMYAVLIPLIAVVLDFAITRITGDGSVGFYEISAFEIMFTMLGMQLLCFETLKRFGSCATD